MSPKHLCALRAEARARAGDGVDLLGRAGEGAAAAEDSPKAIPSQREPGERGFALGQGLSPRKVTNGEVVQPRG